MNKFKSIVLLSFLCVGNQCVFSTAEVVLRPQVIYDTLGSAITGKILQSLGEGVLAMKNAGQNFPFEVEIKRCLASFEVLSKKESSKATVSLLSTLQDEVEWLRREMDIIIGPVDHATHIDELLAQATQVLSTLQKENVDFSQVDGERCETVETEIEELKDSLEKCKFTGQAGVISLEWLIAEMNGLTREIINLIGEQPVGTPFEELLERMHGGIQEIKGIYGVEENHTNMPSTQPLVKNTVEAMSARWNVPQLVYSQMQPNILLENQIGVNWQAKIEKLKDCCSEYNEYSEQCNEKIRHIGNLLQVPGEILHSCNEIVAKYGADVERRLSVINELNNKFRTAAQTIDEKNAVVSEAIGTLLKLNEFLEEKIIKGMRKVSLRYNTQRNYPDYTLAQVQGNSPSIISKYDTQAKKEKHIASLTRTFENLGKNLKKFRDPVDKAHAEQVWQQGKQLFAAYDKAELELAKLQQVNSSAEMADVRNAASWPNSDAEYIKYCAIRDNAIEQLTVLFGHDPSQGCVRFNDDLSTELKKPEKIYSGSQGPLEICKLNEHRAEIGGKRVTDPVAFVQFQTPHRAVYRVLSGVSPNVQNVQQITTSPDFLVSGIGELYIGKTLEDSICGGEYLTPENLHKSFEQKGKVYLLEELLSQVKIGERELKKATQWRRVEPDDTKLSCYTAFASALGKYLMDYFKSKEGFYEENCNKISKKIDYINEQLLFIKDPELRETFKWIALKAGRYLIGDEYLNKEKLCEYEKTLDEVIVRIDVAKRLPPEAVLEKVGLAISGPQPIYEGLPLTEENRKQFGQFAKNKWDSVVFEDVVDVVKIVAKYYPEMVGVCNYIADYLVKELGPIDENFRKERKALLKEIAIVADKALNPFVNTERQKNIEQGINLLRGEIRKSRSLGDISQCETELGRIKHDFQCG